MKYIILLFMMLSSLTGCNAFLVAAQLPSAAYLSPPQIQHWQKKETIGYTNTEQRWQDFKDCGVRQYRDGRLDLNVGYTDLTDEEFIQRRIKIKACMFDKGYVYLDSKQCVDYDKEELTGLCN